MSLTPKKRLFIAEYLVDFNATRAGGAAGYSKRTAQEQGSRLLSIVMVRRQIEDRLRQREKQLKAFAEQKAFNTLERLIDLANMPPKETKGSIMGQVKACRTIAEIRGELVTLHGDVT